MISPVLKGIDLPEQAEQAFRNRELGKRMAGGFTRPTEAGLQTHGALDFDSLILRTYQLFRKFPVFAQRRTSRFYPLYASMISDTNLCPVSSRQEIASAGTEERFRRSRMTNQIITSGTAPAMSDQAVRGRLRPTNLHCLSITGARQEVVELANRLINTIS